MNTYKKAFQKCRLTFLVLLFFSSFASQCFAVVDAFPTDWPTINGCAINPDSYRHMQEHGHLPLKTTYLSDEEVAQKFDLNLPQLADVKAALEKKDPAALKAALVGYLNSKLPPLKPSSPSKPLPNVHHPNPLIRPDTWLQEELTMVVNSGQTGENAYVKKTFPLGEKVNWYYISDGVWGGCDWYNWGNALGEAYIATGDVKYAEALLKYARQFYQKCRPPAQKITSYAGAAGPWSIGGRGRMMGTLQEVYRMVGGAPVTTDEDKLMFLKLIYEHGECMSGLAETPGKGNMVFYPIEVLALMARQFPEFKDSESWRQQSIKLVLLHMDDSMLDDGGVFERTEYGIGFPVSYARNYRNLMQEGTTLPEEFRKRLELMFEWLMWGLTPLYQWPSLNIGCLNDHTDHAAPAAELFPERPDLVYFATKGAKGKPPQKTARVLGHTGFLTMRSDWTGDALYLAVNYNGSTPQDANCAMRQLLSFGLWAHGRTYLTNAGAPRGYIAAFGEWETQTKAANTVMVDNESQQLAVNGGRLQNWSEHPDFTYFAAETVNYRNRGVLHRRATLFLKQNYWVMFDRLTPMDSSAKEHDYRWQAHFQPMEITVDAKTKTAASSVVDGKRLYVVPAEPGKQELEQGEGFIADDYGAHTEANTLKGPFIRYIQKSNKPVSFTVLLCPTTNNAPAPVLSTLPIKAGKSASADDATGVQIRHEGKEDIIAMAKSTGLREYGPLTTDGEAAYVRRAQGKVMEAGLVGGQKLSYTGKTLIEVGSEIASVDLKYTEEKITVDVRGNGKIAVDANSGKTLVLNGKEAPAGGKQGNRWLVEVKSPGTLDLGTPTFANDAESVFRATLGPHGKSSLSEHPVVVSWKTSMPADASIEYAPMGIGDWKRNLKPDEVTDHRLVLSPLTPGTTYRFRIRSIAEDGRIGKTELVYPCPEVKP